MALDIDPEQWMVDRKLARGETTFGPRKKGKK